MLMILRKSSHMRLWLRDGVMYFCKEEVGCTAAYLSEIMLGSWNHQINSDLVALAFDLY